MATAIPKSELSALVSAIVALPAAFILWEGDPKRPVDYGSDAKRIIMNVASRRAVGVDEETREYPPDPDNQPDGLLVRTTFSGQRAVTISVRAENMGSEEGFDLLERLRTLIQADENRAALNELGLALATTGEVRTFPASAGNRKISVSSVDVTVNQRVETVITKQGDTYIDKLEGDIEVET